MIYLRIIAYNSGKTLARAIESVLNQSNHSESIRLFLCDNGSTDGGATRRIVDGYANSDNRVTAFFNERNGDFTGNERLHVKNMCNELNDDDLFCILDADDEYAPDFLEKMLAFMEENDLDVAACGHDFVDAKTNQFTGVRKLDNNMILDSAERFNEFFSNYHAFMRTIWCKVYRMSLLKQCDFGNYDISKLKYGSDTLFCMRAFKHARRVGILAESLHKYYISPKSISYKFDRNRIISDQILHDETEKFLIDKAGFVSPQNKVFLFCVYFNAIKDTIQILRNTKISFAEKLAGLRDIFTSPQTRELADFTFHYLSEYNQQKSELFKQITDWLATQNVVRFGDGLQHFAEIIAVTGEVPVFTGWNNAATFKLLAKAREKTQSSKLKCELDGKIVSAASQQPLLIGYCAEFLVFFMDVTICVLNDKLIDALELIVVIIEEGREIPAGFGIPFVTLGLNLSAKLGKSEYFIFLKKLQVSLLLDAGLKEKASAELGDLDELMPNDEDFRELRRMIAEYI